MNFGYAIDKATQTMALIKMLTSLRRMALVLLVALPLTASAAGQKTFATPDAAVDALVAALKADDDAAILALFGDAVQGRPHHARPRRQLGITREDRGGHADLSFAR